MSRRNANLSIMFVVILMVTIVMIWSTQKETSSTGNESASDDTVEQSEVSKEPVTDEAPKDEKNDEEDSRVPTGFEIKKVATGLDVPWSIVFTSQHRMLVTERSGNVRVIIDGVLQEKPLYTFHHVSQQSEEGLMGLAIDPEYANNRQVYACIAHAGSSGITDSVVSLRDDGDILSNERTLLEGIPAAQYHAGCRLAFGPDDKLYVTTGDATDKTIAQELNSLGGKILRINTDGSIPSDNPFPNSPVYSYGHRNPQGIAWIPSTGVLIATEHGPSSFDGPAGGDEVNRIEPGKNYGWPIVSHDKSQDGLLSPLKQYTPAVAPASALIYSGKAFPDWKDNLFFGALVGEGLYRVTFNDPEATAIVGSEKMNIDVGRVRAVTEGPDGFLYFSTSNTDSRGTDRGNDDTIYVITPTY